MGGKKNLQERIGKAVQEALESKVVTKIGTKLSQKQEGGDKEPRADEDEEASADLVGGKADEATKKEQKTRLGEKFQALAFPSGTRRRMILSLVLSDGLIVDLPERFQSS